VTPSKQKHRLKLSAHINRTAVFVDQGCGLEEIQDGFGDNSWLTLVRAS